MHVVRFGGFDVRVFDGLMKEKICRTLPPVIIIFCDMVIFLNLV